MSNIQQEYDDLTERMLRIPSYYIDFDGSHQPMPLSDAQEAELARLMMLEELMQLSKPLSNTEWAIDMRFGMCPCTPALTKQLDSYKAYMEDE